MCNVYATDTKLTVFSPQFFNIDPNKEIYSLQQGLIKGQVTIKNQTDTTQSAVLILALYNKTDGEMEQVEVKKFDNVSVGETRVISNNINIATAQGYVLKALVWNDIYNLDDIFSLKEYDLYDVDIAPDVPQNFRTTNTAYFTQQIAWDEPQDNLGVVSYEVYCYDSNEVFIKSSITTSPEFADANLNYGTVYKYKVKAVDASGNKSDFSIPYTSTTNSPAWVKFGTLNVHNSLIDQEVPYTSDFAGGSYSEVTTIEGVECREINFIKPYNGNSNGAANYLSIGVSSTYIKKTDNNVIVRLTCFDKGTDTIGIEYNSTSNSYQKVTIAKGNTNTWKTFDFVLTDAAFDNQQMSKLFDLRINTGESNTKEDISKIEIFKGPLN